MKKFLLLSVVMTVISSLHVFSQNMITKQVIICSGGSISNPDDFVTIATYSPTTGITTTFDTIYTQSVQDVIVDNEIAYVAAQDSIVKYNLNSYTRLAAVEAQGVHKLAVRKDVLVATFWYPLTTGFVKSYSLSDLSHIVTFDGVSDEADGIHIFPGDTYSVVAVPGGWGSTTGKLAWLDIDNHELITEHEMNEYGNGVSFFVTYYTGIPHNLAITKTPWGDSTFYAYGFNITGQPTGVYKYNATMQGYTGQDKTILYAQINDGIGQIDLENHVVIDEMIVEPPELTISSSIYDTVNKLFYVSTTDYSTLGEGNIYNPGGEIVGSFEAGISPEAIAIDYRVSSGNKEISNDQITVYPNPASDFVTIACSDNNYNYVTITDISGRIVYSEKISFTDSGNTIDISGINKGIYFISLNGKSKSSNHTIIKK